jgi:large subunit ribosomal protein L20
MLTEIGRYELLLVVLSFTFDCALLYLYLVPQVKKRDMRKLWIQRINAATRMYGVPYNLFMFNLARGNIALNRKVLADLAVTEPLSFKSVVEVSKLVTKTA